MSCRSRGLCQNIEEQRRFDLRRVMAKKCHSILGTLVEVREKGYFSI